MTDTNEGANPPPVPAEIDWSTEPTPVFTNFVTAHVLSEFISLFFLDYNPAAVRQPKDNPHVHIKVVSSLRMTPSAMAYLVGFLVQIWNAYVDALPTEEERKKHKRYTERAGGSP